MAENKKTAADFAIAAGNSATDPGVLFNLGTAAAASAYDPNVSLGCLGVSGLCFVVRGVTELQKLDITFDLTPRLANIVKNPGNAMATAGMINLANAATNIDTSNPETIVPCALATCFGLTSVLRGTARSFENGSIQQRMMDCGGIMTAMAGFLIANPDSPLLVQGTFIISGLMASYLALRNKISEGIAQPDLSFTAASLLNAANSETPEAATANTLWALGYISVDAMKKRGSIFSNRATQTASLPTIAPSISIKAEDIRFGVDFEMEDRPYYDTNHSLKNLEPA